MTETNPMNRVAKVWEGSSIAQREHIRFIWPDLHAALTRLAEANSHVVTDPSSVRVPPMTRPVPRRGSSGPSAGRSGASGMEPTSTPGIPGQMPLPLDSENEK